MSGFDFPPGTEVEIAVGGKFRGTAQVTDAGSFEWGESVKPRLGCGVGVFVVVGGAGGIEVEGSAEVFCP